MGLQLVCDSCHKPVLSALLLAGAQNPQSVSHVCIRCVRDRMDQLGEKEAANEES